MKTRLVRIATLLAGLALVADTALAQGRRDRGQGGQGQGRSAEPRGGGRAERGNGGSRQESGARARREDNGGRRTERQPSIARQPRMEVQPRSARPDRSEGAGRLAPQPRVESQRRRDPQLRFENRAQSGDRSGWEGRYRADDRRAVPRPAPYYGSRDYRDRDYRYRDVRPRVAVPQYRYYGGYRPYPRHTYVVPYGYRPYGYGPGWNFSLYFGRPYGTAIYGNTGYGYYGIDPGFAYGSLRIVDAPRHAQVVVDGYYAGEVDDYDGIFQRLNLEPGPHHIEIVIDDSTPPLEFDVQIAPGATVTIHAR